MLHKIRWTAQKIAARIALIQPLVYRQREPMPPFRYKALSRPEEHPPVGADVDDSAWEVVRSETYWGGWRTDFMLRTTFQVPASFDNDAPVALVLPLGEAKDFSHPESLAYIDGRPYASADRHHREIVLPAWVRDGQPHGLALHGWTGQAMHSDPNERLFMRECVIAQIDQPTRDFIAMARVALDVTTQLDDDNPAKGRIFNALEAAFVALDTRDPLGTDAFYDSVPAAIYALKQGLSVAGDPMNVDVVAIAHAHIDVAWLWTLAQTMRKTGRTFSNVLRLMEEYPDFTFSQSQPQLYQYAEQHYPDLFEQIKARVAEGRWETMGGTWVEPDCNCIGAESLARQFLLGRGYFRKHFGDGDTPVLWLPDTFGYSWALPQLIKLAGMKYFVTHKMSWNQYNQMPNQILWWQGLDGTRVLTHFLTTPSGSEYLPYSTTYNGEVSALEIFGTWENFRQKETYHELTTVYGYGDGGGGPTREMLENIEQLACTPGAPRVRFGTVREYMQRIEDEIADSLPVWNGEFYFEYHRGTYTSQARNKRHNRKSEVLLHDAEFLAAWAALVTDYVYPHDDLRKAWELVCLNQFHDILPGSSIGEVYVDSERDYSIIRELGEKVREDAINALAQTLPSNAAVIAINTTSFHAWHMGLLQDTLDDETQLLNEKGQVIAKQAVEDGTLIAMWIESYAVSSLHQMAYDKNMSVNQSSAAGPYLWLSREPDNKPILKSLLSATTAAGQTVLEQEMLRVEINANGDITRIYDKTFRREVLALGAVGNALLAFEDRPMQFDAWDIDIFYEDRVEKIEGVESIRIIETGPLRAGVEIIRRYRSSMIRQRIYLYHTGRRIDFDTWIDWHEHHILLKTAFPVNILSPVATFDVQWGNVQRPTHRNTSWDWARFETCAHKWADLSEGDYGVALLNDCKYGYDIHDNVMRLSLLKSATSPDRDADQGEHRMTYSLLPHLNGDWSPPVAEAYQLNSPLILRRVSNGAGTLSRDAFLWVNDSRLIIETVKQAEDGRGIIVRLYENFRTRGEATFGAGFRIAEAYICNLLEEDETPLTVTDNHVEVEYTPYQIITLRLIPE